MNRLSQTCREELRAELETIPDEYLPFVLRMFRAFRDSITLVRADASFRQGWQEVQQGMTYPLEDLWNGIDGQ